MFEQVIVLSVILIILVLFIEGSIKYEFVSLAGLLMLIVTGIVPAEEAFLGFGHSAVITVAAVLVISESLVKSGIVEYLVMILNKGPESPVYKVGGLMLVTAFLSAFMNNVGALALTMPVAIQLAKDSNTSPSQFLMPIAFASLLGGMVTAIGTPPNLIISSYMVQAGKEAFAFFDFLPVGLAMVLLGILLTLALGRKLIPNRKPYNDKSIFNIEAYLSELVVEKNSKMVNRELKDFYTKFNLDLNILGIIREGRKIVAPQANDKLLVGDLLIIKADSKDLTDIIKRTGLTLKGAKTDELGATSLLKSESIGLVEVVLKEESFLVGRTALETKLRNKYNANLIAVSRKGVSSFERLKSFRFKAGDVLLMQIPVATLEDSYSRLGCLPLAERGLGASIDQSKGKRILTGFLFISSIIIASLGLMPVQVIFTAVAVALVVFKVLTPREFYNAIEWPTIIMLGSLLPLGDALQTSGGSATIANFLIKFSVVLSPSMMVGLLMLISIILTNIMNNTALTVLMAPIALTVSEFMGVSPEPFLMGVCVAASSAFMTPIGHQSNMLVMEPGGYKFTDYWYLGLPLSLLVLLIGGPLILYIWPL